MKKPPTAAQQQAAAVRAYVLAHPHCTREQIEQECGLLYNDWDKLKKHVRLTAHRDAHKRYTFTVEADEHDDAARYQAQRAGVAFNE